MKKVIAYKISRVLQPDGVMTTRIAGGLTSPKRALLPAPLKGIPYNFSMTIARCVVSGRLEVFKSLNFAVPLYPL